MKNFSLVIFFLLFWIITVGVLLFTKKINAVAATSTQELVITAQVISTTTTSTPPESTTTPLIQGNGGQGIMINQQQPFVIINIEVLEIGANFLKIKFTTNKNSFGELNYGFSYDFDKTIWDNSFQNEHIFSLQNLKEDTLYYYQIVAKDNQGNRITSQVFNFRTLSKQDNEPPANPSNFTAEIKGLGIYLFWSNPIDSDFSNVILLKDTREPPTSPFSGRKIYEGTNESFIDEDIIQGETFYYTLFSVDTSGNVSSGTILKIIFPSYDIIDNLKPIKRMGEELKVSVKETEKLLLNNAQVDIKNGELRLELGEAPKVQKLKKLRIHYFPNQQVKITLNKQNFKKQPTQIIFSFANLEEHLFRYENSNRNYIVDFKTPLFAGGKYNIKLMIIYKDGSVDLVEVGEILIDPYGYVYRRIIRQKIALFKKLTIISLQEKFEEEKVSSAKITLYHKNKNKNIFEMWPGYNYDQKNPQFTNERGEYGFMVPAGIYYLEAVNQPTNEKYETEPFEVVDRVINKNIEIGITYIYWYQDPDNILVVINLILLISLLITLLYLIYKRSYKSKLTDGEIK